MAALCICGAETDKNNLEEVCAMSIQKTYEFIKNAGTYYLATVDKDQPRVRPFGTIHIFEGKLYIQTGRKKDARRTSRSSSSPTAGRRSAPSRTAPGSAFPVSSLTTRAARQRPPCSVNTLHCVKSAIRRMTRIRWCSTSSPAPSHPSLPPLVIRQSRCSSNELLRSISTIICFSELMDEEKSQSRCMVVQTYGN